MPHTPPSPATPPAQQEAHVHAPRILAVERPLWGGLLGQGMLLLAFAAVWLGHLNAVALSPPADNIEQWVWMQSLQAGYYKHPPLPTWLMWLAAQVGGRGPEVTVALGATLTLATLALMAALLRDVGDPRFSWVALLGVLCITFYNGRLNYYNHNVVLMVWVTAFAWTWWQVLSRPRWRWWVVMGFVAGGGMLSKYQFMVAVGCAMWLFVASGLWRERRHWLGAALAMGVAIVVVSPHLVWLLTTDSPTPFNYALTGSLGASLSGWARVKWDVIWAADWIFNRCLPALVLVGAVAWATRGQRSPQPAHAPHEPTHARLFLRVWGIGPIVFMLGLGLAFGADLQVQWGTAFAAWIVPLAMWELNLRDATLSRRAIQVAVLVFLWLQLGLLALSYHTSSRGSRPSTHWRNFPAQALVADIAPKARALAGGPIDVVSGPTAVAGMMSHWMDEHPKVLIDGRLDLSPWLRPDDLARARTLHLWPPGAGPADAIPSLDGWRFSVGSPSAPQRVEQQVDERAPPRADSPAD